MIFVTVGSQKFQFDRLLKSIDELVECGIITEDIFAQTGASNYNPKNYYFKSYINREEFDDKLNKCDIVITHGGTGVIVNALKKGKKVIAVPRLVKYNEHVDDHQMQLLEEFQKSNLICTCFNTDEIGNVISEIRNIQFDLYVSNAHTYLEEITRYIESL